MDFFWNVQEDFPRDLTNPSTFSFKRQPQGNYKLRVSLVLEKLQKINPVDKGSLRQWLQGVLFALYDWNEGPVDRTEITISVV